VVANPSEVRTTPVEVVGPAPTSRVEYSSVTGATAGPVESYGAAATCAEMVGGAQAVLDLTVEYAKTREQFGKPIGTFQAVQHHCANSAIDVLGARFIAYEAIWHLAEGKEAEVSVAKAWVSEAYERVCALAHQVHGAIGFTAEHDLHHYTRHAMSTALSFGDADTHYDRLATQLGI
jgi:alkylation response protein AidB-like acyl-CoA dehydrogenase